MMSGGSALAVIVLFILFFGGFVKIPLTRQRILLSQARKDNEKLLEQNQELLNTFREAKEGYISLDDHNQIVEESVTEALLPDEDEEPVLINPRNIRGVTQAFRVYDVEGTDQICYAPIDVSGNVVGAFQYTSSDNEDDLLIM